MQPPPGYYRDQPPPPPPRPQTEPLARWSLCCSAGGVLTFFCLGWPLCLVGTMLGIVSLCTLHRNPHLEGKALAWVGTLLGGIPMTIYLYFVLQALRQL